MKRLYYLLWAVRLVAGLFVDLYDAIQHWRNS